MATLSTAIVTYRPDLDLLYRCIKSLNASVNHARESGDLSGVSLRLIDNSTDPKTEEQLKRLLSRTWDQAPNTASVRSTQRNLGYGMAHNLAITETATDYHLVLNPDVILEDQALHHAIRFMEGHQDTALLTPHCCNDAGIFEHLNKRYPDPAILLVRGLGLTFLNNLFKKKNAHYEMHDLDPGKTSHGIPLASGCFMFFRTSVLRRLGGFSDRYFLYFEDYDLSIRTRQHGDIAYVPDVRIVHYGGNAASKGMKHILMFMQSAARFFNQHGWKWR